MRIFYDLQEVFAHCHALCDFGHYGLGDFDLMAFIVSAHCVLLGVWWMLHHSAQQPKCLVRLRQVSSSGCVLDAQALGSGRIGGLDAGTIW